METVAPLLSLSEANGDLTITPHPVLVDQIDRYFVRMPKDLCTAVNGVKDRTRVLFLEHHCYLFQKNNGDKEKSVFVVKRQMESIAHALRMDCLLDVRKDERLRKRLNGLYEYAKGIGYLKDYVVDQPGTKHWVVDRLHLDSKTFKAMRKPSSQMSQGLHVNVAEATSNGCSDVKIEKENQYEK